MILTHYESKNQRLLIVLIIISIIGIYFLSSLHWITLVPYLLVLTKENGFWSFASMAKLVVLMLVWEVMFHMALWPILMFCGRFSILVAYLPVSLITFLNPHAYKRRKWYRTVFYLLWDLPLMTWVYMVHLLGSRALEPFYSVISANLIVGSMPVPGGQDVSTLKGLRVGAVVNMCLEYSGPVEEYSHAGIKQHRVPTLDISEPDYVAIVQAIHFISEFLHNNPEERVFIHCKGGRSRAVTMALCYLMTLGSSVEEALALIASQRCCTDKKVIEYPVVNRLKGDLERFEGDFSAVYKAVSALPTVSY